MTKTIAKEIKKIEDNIESIKPKLAFFESQSKKYKKKLRELKALKTKLGG